MTDLIIIAHNLRSTHNVGSLFRTAEGLGVNKLILTGYTPYPKMPSDPRLPHLADKIHRQIIKTSLDAETYLNWERFEDLDHVISDLKDQGYQIVALEQTSKSIPLNKFPLPPKLVLLLGNEADGLDQHSLSLSDCAVEIPMAGRKESFNVVQATTMAMYQFLLVK